MYDICAQSRSALHQDGGFLWPQIKEGHISKIYCTHNLKLEKAVNLLAMSTSRQHRAAKARMQMIPHTDSSHQSSQSSLLLLRWRLLTLLFRCTLCLSSRLSSSSLRTIILAHWLNHALLLLRLNDGDRVRQ